MIDDIDFSVLDIYQRVKFMFDQQKIIQSHKNTSIRPAGKHLHYSIHDYLL